jgi:hypothetical protein
VRVPGLVGRGHHVLERLLRENLRLIEDLDVDFLEATAEPLLAGAEHDDRPVAEPDLLLAVRGADAVVRDVGKDLLALHEPLHRAERPRQRPVVVRGPQHRQTGEQDAQRHHDPTHQERLRHLAGDAQGDAADRRGVQAISPLAEDRPA